GGDRGVALAASLVDQTLVVVGLRIQRIERYGPLELLQRLVVAAERTERTRIARAQSAVLGLALDELRVEPRCLVVTARLAQHTARVPIALRRARTEMAERGQAFEDLRVDAGVVCRDAGVRARPLEARHGALGLGCAQRLLEHAPGHVARRGDSRQRE